MDRFKHRIDVYNRVVGKMELRKSANQLDDVPKRLTLLGEMENIRTRQDMERRAREIQLFSQREMQEPVEYKGFVVTRYQAEMVEKYKNDLNELQKYVRTSLYDWDNMTEQQRATAESTGNISELKGSYWSGEDLQDLINRYYAQTDAAYFEKYIDVWHEYCTLGQAEEDEVARIITRIMRRKPGLMRILLEGWFECQISYIYDTKTDWHSLHSRHEEIFDFWNKVDSGEYDRYIDLND